MRTNTRTLMLVSAAMGAVPPNLRAEKPPLQLAERGARVDPVRIAKVRVVEDRIRLDGEWVGVSGALRPHPESGDCIWDCYGRSWGIGSCAQPDEPRNSLCGIGGSRWYYGSGYHDPMSEDDVRESREAPLTFVDWGFYWEPAVPRPLIVVILWNGTGDPDTCQPATPRGDLGGIAFDYGTLESQAPYFSWSHIDVTALGPTFPAPAIRSHTVMMFDHLEPEPMLAPGPCQPMMWGTPSNNGTGYIAFPCAIGDQTDAAYDDDAPTDGRFDPVAECYTISGPCPDPLGKMIAYGTFATDACTVSDGCYCRTDFNSDGFVTGDDFDLFVIAFVNANLTADFNGDGFVTGDDFDAFVAEFILGC